MSARQRSGSASLLGPRDVNEDNYELTDFSRAGGEVRALIAVADGMGGLSAGDLASQTAVESVREVVFAGGGAEELTGSVALADQQIRDLAAERGGSMGTTLTAALVEGSEATVVHVGDTRAYLIHNGTISQITEDHSRVGRLLAEGVLTEEEAMSHPEQNVLEQALGAGDATGDTYRIGIGPGDVLFVCSDGLHTFVSSAEIGYELDTNVSLQAACEHLARLAEERGSDDNITAVAWEYPSPDPFVGGARGPTDTIVTRAPGGNPGPGLAQLGGGGPPSTPASVMIAGLVGFFVGGFLIGLLLSAVI